MRTRLEVRGIAEGEELRRAVAAGVDPVGRVAPKPSGPGPIPLERAAALARPCRPAETSVRASATRTAESLRLAVETVQPLVLPIVDRIGEPVRCASRRAFPRLRLVPVAQVEGPGAVGAARAAAPSADAPSLASGRPAAAVPEPGGSGRTPARAIARAVVGVVALPVFLAGGFRAETIGPANGTVRPFRVDVCSGVRRAGRLDPGRLAARAAAVAAA